MRSPVTETLGASADPGTPTRLRPRPGLQAGEPPRVGMSRRGGEKPWVLVTGGAGFIGSHVVDRLLAQGQRVRVLDSLDPQVHGQGRRVPEHLDPAAQFIRGDVTDRVAVDEAIEGVGRIVHLAAAVGVGQSMYAPAAYTAANDLGTAVLLEAMAPRAESIRRLVVASSMSIYGEGRYRDSSGRVRDDVRRELVDLEQDRWEPADDTGRSLVPMPTDESKQPDLASVYALNKWVQERMCLLMGQTYRVPTTALRFFNVYGPRQALSNPYTGVMAIFASRILNGRPPLVFEDGQQRRDFVSVHDVADAVVASTLDDALPTGSFNIGSGQAVTIHELGRQLAAVLGRSDLEPQMTGKFRVGDIRHCFADIGKAHRELGYHPRVDRQAGIAELAGWLEGQTAEDRVEAAHQELQSRGLAV